MPLNWQTVTLPLAAGLDTKGDARASDPPKLDICRDVQFDELGGVQTRYPFAAMSNSIFGGGTLSGCRRLAVVNDELCVFTADSMYSWNAQISAWVLRGTHLAVNVTETPRFATTGDQLDGDRAELNGTIVYAWSEGGILFVAASDKATGAVLMSPFSMIAISGRPRLVALNTKIMLFFENIGALTAIALDPANPATALSGGPTVTVAAAAVFNSFYDVVKVDGQDLAIGVYRRDVTTSYSVFTCTPALAVTTSTKARTADGPVAIATTPGGGLQTQVIRHDTGVAVRGDFLTTSSLADLTINQTIVNGAFTAANQIAAAYRSVTTGGAFRCYVYVSSEAPTSGLGTIVQNFVDTAGTIGTATTLMRILGVASRAFDYNGSVYVWFAFAGQSTVATLGPFKTPPFALQNTYFLYRDDGLLVAKCVATRGGGFLPAQGRLPGVTLTSGTTEFSWCATLRRKIQLGTGDVDFAAREPVDVVFAFDSNAARRVDRIGRTLYIAAGEVLQYDGVRLVETGFHIYPWILGIIDAGGGSVATGTYSYKQTYRYLNAQGETERSTTATIASITNTGSSLSILTSTPLTATHKTSVVPAAEFWRTAVAPTSESPFFLVSSQDPAVLTNPNRYVPNSTTATTLPTFNDFLADASITIREANPENGAILESLAPPGASIIIASDTRLFLGGVAGDPDRVWYSRLRGDGEIASFHDGNVVPIPRTGGDITALVFNAETLTVFRSTAIYALLGQGVDNAGGGQNFESRTISVDVGAVSQESVAFTPKGVIFKSRKGWYLLSPSWQVQYIGGQVNAFDADTVYSIDVVETQHHVRILTNGRTLIWDYLVNQWGEWTIADGLHSVIWNGSHVYLTATGPKLQSTTYSSLTYGVDGETAWWKPAGDQQGEATVRWFSVLGEYRSSCLILVRVARDYQYDGAGNAVYYDDTAWLPSPTVVGSALQVKHTPSLQIVQSIKVRITAVALGARATLSTGALSGAVNTSGTNWTAAFNVFDFVSAGKLFKPGLMGNSVTMSLGFQTGTAVLVDVRDHYRYVPSESRWVEDPDNIGVRIVTPAATLTVGALETAIQSGTTLAQLQTADATP